MKDFKLIPMTDFVLHIKNNGKKEYDPFFDNFKLELIYNYTDFLKQPLKLGMFVACWFRNGIYTPIKSTDLINTTDLFKEWNQAKENVLFKGFEYVGECEQFWELNHYLGYGLFIEKNKLISIEKALLNNDFDIELTESAIKKIGL